MFVLRTNLSYEEIMLEFYSVDNPEHPFPVKIFSFVNCLMLYRRILKLNDDIVFGKNIGYMPDSVFLDYYFTAIFSKDQFPVLVPCRFWFIPAIAIFIFPMRPVPDIDLAAASIYCSLA